MIRAYCANLNHEILNLTNKYLMSSLASKLCTSNIPYRSSYKYCQTKNVNDTNHISDTNHANANKFYRDTWI